MAWQIKLETSADKELDKLERQTQDNIITILLLAIGNRKQVYRL